MPGTESLRTVLLRMAELSISPQPEQTTQREEAHINDSVVVLLLLEMLQERFGLCRTRLDVALVRGRVTATSMRVRMTTATISPRRDGSG